VREREQVPIPDRLCEGPMGLGVDAAPVDGQVSYQLVFNYIIYDIICIII
jgi:hypothetical protein